MASSRDSSSRSRAPSMERLKEKSKSIEDSSMLLSDGTKRGVSSDSLKLQNEGEEDWGGDGGGGDQQSRFIRPLPSGVSNDLSLNSYSEVVAINEEGHQYIDIDRLIYQPRSDEKDRSKEKLSSLYLPDFTFIIVNILSIGCIVYFVSIGSSTLQWQSSLKMFELKHCEEKRKELDTNNPQHLFYIPCKIFKYHTQFHSNTYHKLSVIRVSLGEYSIHGTIFILTAVGLAINTLIGINACMRGYKPLLIQHVIIDVIIVLIQFFVCIIFVATGTCNKHDLAGIRVLLTHYVRTYGVTSKPSDSQSEKEKMLSSQVDGLQMGLGCCGADSWADYLPGGYPYWDRQLETVDLDGGESIIPFSCCRRWWIRNIYCSQAAHLLAAPTATKEMTDLFYDRINQDGCMYKMEKLCQTLINLYGFIGIYVVIIHIVLICVETYAVAVLVKNINKIIHMQRKAMMKKEMMHEPENSISELDLNLSVKSGGSSATGHGKEGSGWSKLPPPTEDEISTIKQKSNFNKFVAAMKHGRVGRWMETARHRVMEGQEGADGDLGNLTAEEKKAKEKELLKQKKDHEKGDIERKSRASMIGMDGENFLETETEGESAPGKRKKKRKRKSRHRRKRKTSESDGEEERVRRRRRRRRIKKRKDTRKPWWNYFGGLQ